MKYDLSIIIPALKEEFVAKTIEDIVANKRGKTEVIAVLDGEWAEPPIADHPDVRVIKLSKNVGQRAATNIGVRLSKAKYVAKCDAHCAFDEGFDVKLVEAIKDHPDWTIAPTMRNLHVFDWVCKNCQMRTYQGPVPNECRNEICGGAEDSTGHKDLAFEKDIVWYPKPSPNSTAYKFTPDRLQFKYFGTLKKYQEGNAVESMSLQGSFFMLSREKYLGLNICDESWGGWGQQGTEVALKSWLSGGKVMIIRDTWYAHMFRTQQGFAFPWGNPARQQQQAREISYELFTKNAWDKQVRPLSWLVERFWEPLQQEPDKPDDRRWTQADLAHIKTTEGLFREVNAAGTIDEMDKPLSLEQKAGKGIIYYTDNELPVRFAHKIQDQIKSVGLPIVSASLKPMDKMGKNVHVPGKRGYMQMFRQILAALEASSAEIVFFCEADVLYHPSHFDFTPPKTDKFYYNLNWWSVRKDGFAVHWEANRVSQLVCNREYALEFYRKRIAEIESKGFNRSYEPGGRNPDLYENYRSVSPNVDIRHKGTLTGNKWSPADFRDKSSAKGWAEGDINSIPGWKPEDFKGIVIQ